MKLKDIYRPDAVTIDPDHDLAAAARRMELAQVGALAVVEQAGRLVGIFTERDLVRAIARSAANPADVWVSAHASFRPETAHVEEDSRDVARPMLDLGFGTCRSPPATTSWSGWCPCATCWPSRPGCREALHGCDPSNRPGAPRAPGTWTVRFGVPAHPPRRPRGPAGPDPAKEPAAPGNQSPCRPTGCGRR